MAASTAKTPCSAPSTPTTSTFSSSPPPPPPTASRTRLVFVRARHRCAPCPHDVSDGYRRSRKRNPPKESVSSGGRCSGRRISTSACRPTQQESSTLPIPKKNIILTLLRLCYPSTRVYEPPLTSLSP